MFIKIIWRSGKEKTKYKILSESPAGCRENPENIRIATETELKLADIKTLSRIASVFQSTKYQIKFL